MLTGISLPAEEIGGIILAPKILPQGNQVSITVTTSLLTTQAPVSAPVTVDLLDAQGNSLARIFEGQTNEEGMADISYLVPTDLIGPHTLRGEVAGQPFDVAVNIVNGPAVLIETDKPIYQPGQTIQGRVLLVNNALQPVEGDIEVTFKDGKGIRIDRQFLTSDAFGVAPFSLPLATQLNMGVWTIAAASGETSSELTVRVEKYVLPQFTVDVSLDKSWFLPEEEIPLTLSSTYFFGKTVEGIATVTASRYVGEWEVYATESANLVDGVCDITIPPVEYTSGTHEYGGDGAVTLDIAVMDTSDHAETTNRILTIAAAPVGVQLIAQQKYIKPELPFSCLVVTETPSGIPMDRTVSVDILFTAAGGATEDMSATVETVDGRGILEFEAPKSIASCFLSAEMVEGDHTATHNLTIFAAHSPTASFLHLSRQGDGTVNVGEAIAVKAETTHGGSLFWEVLAGGKVVTRGATRERTFSFTATPAMMPKVDIVGYTLNPGNELACDTLNVPVALQSRLQLDAAFSVEQARPGEEVTLNFNAHRRSLLGIAVVDESLLALAEEKLTLKSIFDTLEACFMTPRAEVHFDNNDPWAPVTIPGAVETMEDVGLAIGATRSISVPEGTQVESWLVWGGQRGWEWGWMEDGGPVGPPVDAVNGGDEFSGGGTGGYAAVDRVRQFFPETWVWQPTLLTDDNGEASLTLTCPDSITTWHMRAMASSQEGMSMAESQITVFQDFFVRPDLPIEVVRGESFPLKLQVYNYADSMQEIALSLEAADWFELEDPATGTLAVGPNEVTAMTIRIKPVAVGTFPLKVTALGMLHSDAVQRDLRVVPEGVRFTAVENGKISADLDVEINIHYPMDHVPDSGLTMVSITPSLIAQSLSGLEDLIGMPYGCGEQNMIFFAPDVQVLRYLTLTGEDYPEIWAMAENFVNVGYQRELTYRRSDGSFSAFGESDDDGSLYLTAFVLSSFAAARDVKDIDETVLQEAAQWIMDLQQEDGSWEPLGFLHHNELKGGIGGTYSLTAYVAKALAEFDPVYAQTALTAATGYLSANLTTVADQAYPLAVAAYSLSLIPDAGDACNATIDLLLPLAETGNDVMHWEPYPIETTAYAALALLNMDRPQAQEAINYIAGQRGAMGGYGSTQDTVMAFQAITEAALKATRDINASVDLFVDGDLFRTFTINQDNFDLLQSAEIPAGSAQALLRLTGDTSIGYQVARHYNMPGDNVPPPHNMLISVDYETEHIAVDDIVDVNVTLNYTGLREKTNMVIADVGVPTGFAVVQASLDRLIEAGTVSRTEVAIRKVILYLDELTQDTPVTFTFQVKALFPIKASAVSSTAYDYYETDDKGIDGGTPITIGSAQFIRGDANRDGLLDLSDAVTILMYLFSDGELTCQDAADCNDDDSLNLADPVYLLSHMFANSEAPPSPWPEAGDDPTVDGMGCAR